jgi:hypothetical protein
MGMERIQSFLAIKQAYDPEGLFCWAPFQRLFPQRMGEWPTNGQANKGGEGKFRLRKRQSQAGSVARENRHHVTEGVGHLFFPSQHLPMGV